MFDPQDGTTKPPRSIEDDLAKIRGGQAGGTVAPAKKSLEDDLAKIRASSKGGGGAEWGDEPSTGKAFVHGVAKGGTFGTDDELEAALHPMSVKATNDLFYNKKEPLSYEDAHRGAKGRRRALEKSNPTASVVGELLGGGYHAVKGPLASQIQKGAGSVRTGVKEGAKFGALMGGGTSDSETLAGRLGDAAEGGAIGGVMGSAVPFLAKGWKAGINLPGVAKEGSIRHKLGASTAGDVADKRLLDVLLDDGKDVNSLRRPTKSSVGGQPEMLVDQGGANTRGLVRASQAKPNPSKEKLATELSERGEGQLHRIANKIEELLGVPPEESAALVETIAKRQKANAKPAYDQAYKHGAVNDTQINELLTDPDFQRAWKDAVKIAGKEKRQLPEVYTFKMKPGKILDVHGNPIPEEVGELTGIPDVESLDYIKRALDGQINRLMSGESANRTMGRALKEQKKAFLSRLDELVPDFKAARAEFAGEEELKEAAEQGARIFEDRAGKTAKDLAAMSSSEREMYTRSAIDKIVQVMRGKGDGIDLVKTLFGAPEKRDQLKALFPDEDGWRKFQEFMTSEKKMAASKSGVLSGSPTARIALEAADLEGISLSDLAPLAAGRPAWAVVRTLSDAARSQHTKRSKAVADAVGSRAMMRPGTKEYADFLSRLEGVQQRKPSASMTLMSRLFGQQTGDALNE